MSVINTMLKDLDQRQKNQDDGIYHPTAKKSNALLYSLIVLVAMLVVALGITIWYELSLKHKTTPVEAKNEIVENKQVAPAPLDQVRSEREGIKEAIDAKDIVELDQKANIVAQNNQLDRSNELETRAKEEEDLQDLAALEDEIYGVDDYAAEVVEKANAEAKAKLNQNANNASSRGSVTQVQASAPTGKKVLKVTPIQLTKEQEIDLDNKAANIAITQGQLDKAIEAYQSILAKDPKNRQAREKMASLFYGTNNLIQAKKILQQGIALDSGYANYRLILARILMEQDNKQEALQTLSSLSLKAEQSNLDYIATEASLATELKQSTIAIEAYGKLTRIMPKEGKWWFGLALAFDRQNVKSAALSNYKRAISVGVAEASHKFALQRIQELEK